MIKRTIDIIGASVGLCLLSPLLVLTGLLIVLDDGFPVIFRQKRVGLNGKPFSIIKFRTMAPKAISPGPSVTSAGDQRITRLGKYLRRFKIDELPQLINVLSGSMSLVGPRPELPHFMRHYSARQQAVILSVRPGMTDFAAIEFSNEEDILSKYADQERAYINDIMPKKYELYEKYVREQSATVDVALILKTIFKLCRK